MKRKQSTAYGKASQQKRIYLTLNLKEKKMKGKIFSLLTMLLMCIVSACSSDDSAEEPVASLKLDLAVENITENTVDVSITADDQDRTYYAGILRAEDVAEGTTDTELAAALMKDPNFSAGLRKGNAAYTADGLVDNTLYMLVAFGVNSDGTADTMYKLGFMTVKKTVVEGDRFTISQVTPGYTSVKFHVQPSLLTQQWYYYIMERANYDGYLSSEGQSGPITHTYYAWNNYGRDLGLNIGEFLRTVAYSGERDVEVPALQPGKDYVIIVSYVDPMNQVDPTQIFDYEYTATPFTTLQATSDAPTVEFLDYGVNDTQDGYVELYATVRTSTAVNGKYSFSSLANWLAQGDIFANYETDENIAYTMANLFGRMFSDDIQNGLTTQGGYTITQVLSVDDYEESKPIVFSIWVSDEQGKRTAKAVRLD